MTLLSLDGWDVERMAISHYQGDKRGSKTELWRFIRNFLATFHREAEFKATLTTPAKIQVFHTYVEEKFKHEYGRHFDEVGADAWFLAFLCFWSRNRGFVEEEVKRDPFTRKGNFYQTIKNEWDSQRGKGDSR